MKYLLDVNALLAWRYSTAHGHAPFHAWARTEGYAAFGTCAHVELGFLRLSMHLFNLTLSDAQTALAEIKKSTGGFVATAPSPRLPKWSLKASQTSDAYLVQLAASAGLTLATFDTGIPGTHLIR